MACRDREPIDTPHLSVVVTVVEGGPALTRCLDALAMQTGRPDMEVIVPYDSSIAHVAALGSRYPGVKYVFAGQVADDRRDAFAEHGLYERRRAAGLRAARGRLVAMLEDRGEPAPTGRRP